MKTRNAKIIIIAAVAVAAMLVGTSVYESIAPTPDPKISEDVSAVIRYMENRDDWVLSRSAGWAFNAKTHIAVYASRYASVAEINIGVPDAERSYLGISVPLTGADGYAFTQASVKLQEYLIGKRRPVLTDYVNAIKNGGS